MPESRSNGNVGHYEAVAPDELYFDAKNPRLVEFSPGKHPTQDELLRILWEQMAIDEVAMSIAARGFWQHEPLFATKEGGRLVVIEGNRRLAAVRLLLDESLRKELNATDLPKASARVRKTIETLPVVTTTRAALWQFLGFKHVNGPAKWGSYAKARYIAEVRDQQHVSLDEVARHIGDKHKTVQRLYRALMVIKQAEAEGVYNLEHRFRNRFAFSHLYVGLDYEGFQEFLHLKDEESESETPVPKKRLKALGELCTWLWGDKRNETPPLVQSQNPDLRRLADVLRDDRAVNALRSSRALVAAYEVSLGDEHVFRQSLQEARLALQKARGTLTTGYDGEETLLEEANDIVELANDLVEEMVRSTRVRTQRTVKRAAKK